MSVAARNETILEMFDGIRGMVYNFARKFNLEFDDVLQDSALIMLEVYPRIPNDCRNVKGYLYCVVRSELYRRQLRPVSVQTMSLDTPVTAESSVTFADMLADFVEQENKRADHVTKIVHTALRTQSLEVQLHAMDYYGLGSYRPVLPKRRKVKYGRQPQNIRDGLKRSFRKNPQVLALMR